MPLGLIRRTVRLEPHDPLWDASAREVIAMLRELLGPDAVDIQHVGSTAIPAIPAKPTVDIAVGVRALEDVRRHDEALAAHGVIFNGEINRGQFLYHIVRGDPSVDMRTHNIHFMPWQGEAWKNYIAFRDYLNARPDEAARYARLKETLAVRFAQDRPSYTAGKAELISELLVSACAWKENTANT